MLFERLDGVLVQDEVQDIDTDAQIPRELLAVGEEEGTENSHREILERTVKHFASFAFRTILVCYRDMSMEKYEELKS